MGINEIDRALRDAEYDATSPTSPSAHHDFPERRSEEIERVISASSVSTVSSSGPSRRGVGVGMSRVSTQRDLERHPTELSRIHTQRSQHSATVGRDLRTRSRRSSRASTSKPLPNFGAGKPYPPLLPNQEDFVVEFDGPDDPLHPLNWTLKKKLLTAAMLGFTTMIAAFGSSIFSAATRAVAEEFDASLDVSLLGVSLYVLGFAFGPTLWAPLSELKGRRLPLVLSMFGFALFNIANATAKDLQTVLITRFFAGFFGACPLAVVAAVFSDMFDNRTRGVALTVFSMTVFTGPLMAPFSGAFIVDSYLGWRWTSYIVFFAGCAAFVLNLIFLEETYPPVVLIQKAAELRRRTLNWGIHAKQEEIEIDFRELISKNFSRPMRLLFLEPIVTLLSIYMAFIYGLLYLFLTAYPLVFQGVHGMSAGVAGLAFFGMIVGQLIAGATILMQQPWYQRKLAANNGVPVPEWRLPSVIAGGVSFAAGLFWFGWSGYRKDVHWIVPALSGLASGFGLASIFLQALNYLVDSYLMFAASAIAGNAFLRSLAGAGFPLFARYMFNGMGIEWASTLLGCVGVALVPIPVVFYLYGHKIRAKSAYAPTPPPQDSLSSTDTAEDSELGAEKNLNGTAAEASVARKDQDAAARAV
ncbi:major facilitator superfamily domain-containing protein [Podospora australis]|uniref:Major facilitator superfamily domain-containing protein n=1 Tax=Podospora australis TaxID=1536484 RepID=A0AAN7ALU7_9PEZI|nr:major facilitator superfamily domain-containing protein [Podospora australis]